MTIIRNTMGRTQGDGSLVLWVLTNYIFFAYNININKIFLIAGKIFKSY